MTQLLKAFLDIALWRKTPAALPASAFLLTLAAIADAVVEAVQDWLFPDRQHILFNVVVTVAAPLCFTWAALALTKKRHRFFQTGSAVLGIDAMIGLLFLPLEAVARSAGPNSALAPVFALLVYAGLIAYLIANMNVWRAALDVGLISAGLVSLGNVVMQLVLRQESA